MDNQQKIIKGFIIGVCIFFLLVPIIIIVLSYMPQFMIKLAAESQMDYFIQNTLHNFGLKLIISTFVSFLITAVGALLIFSKSKSPYDK